MSIESRIALAKDLIRKREEIDQQLAELFGGATPKKQKCSVCGSAEHTARTCPQKMPPTTPVPQSPFDALSRRSAGEDGSAQS